MSVVGQTPVRFHCNGCGVVSDVQWVGLEYTPPAGWIAVEKDRLEHYCTACTKQNVSLAPIGKTAL